MPDITVNILWLIFLGSTGEKSKSTLLIKANINPVKTIIPPNIPATPKPGITISSNISKITPTKNINISHPAANPSIYKGTKYNTPAINAAAEGKPIPGDCNSK